MAFTLCKSTIFYQLHFSLDHRPKSNHGQIVCTYVCVLKWGEQLILDRRQTQADIPTYMPII